MIAMKLLRIVSILSAVAILVDAVPTDSVQSKIEMLKCCLDKEELVGDSDGNPESSARCEPSGKPWKPFIYSPALENVLDQIPREWNVVRGKKPDCDDSHTLTYVPYRKSNPFVLFDNGQAVLDVHIRQSIEPGQYCADNEALLACMPMKKDGDQAAVIMRPRVRHCCGETGVFHEEKHSCVLLNESMEDTPLLPNASFSVEIVPGFPTCPRSDNFSIVGDTKDALLLPNGSMEIGGVALPAGQFCVERIKELKVSKVFACAEHDSQRPKMQAADIRFTLYPVGFIISAWFLAATLAAGCLLPVSHHVLHWRCQTHHVACLMLGDILMAIIQLAGVSPLGGSCKVLAASGKLSMSQAEARQPPMIAILQGLLAIMDLRPASLEKGQEALRLRVYTIYAWGGPLLVAGVAALLDHLPPQPQYTFLRPRFGEKHCWFYGDMEILAYFYGPIGVLLAVNLLFFAATARELTCGLWKGEFVKSTTERAALGRVCMKLVVVMGVTWVADVVSWVVGGPQYIWYFTDLINAFQGVLIFVVVGCQPQVRAALKRLFNRNPRTNAGRQGNGLSTTSHGMPSMGDSVTQNPSTKTAPLETIC
ncbi:adhesion G-protein coupled receptor methuselah-like 1 [Augochlora pura]